MMNATNQHLPVILIRGFGGLGLDDERRVAYQGFNDGTVYPGKRGENYIYEGMVLKFLKSDYAYYDATNVIGYYGSLVQDERDIPQQLLDQGLDKSFFNGDVVVDVAMAAALLRRPPEEIRRTLWIFRYYDLERSFGTYAKALVRLIQFIRALARTRDEESPKVNIIAHSMGGLIAREAIQVTYPTEYGHARAAEDHINKVVTLGTPHKGISFQVLSNWAGISADDELERFNPDFQADASRPASYLRFDEHFDPRRLLTVVGTNHRTYGNRVASGLNRLFSVAGEYGPTYNRSDGLVKQESAQLPGAPRTFVNKCHGGEDSLVTSREAYEVASRFFYGDVRARLRLLNAEVRAGFDNFGNSEFFLGVCIKPRDVDFELFHQSREAENCYGPYRSPQLNDSEVAFAPLAGGLLWEGWVDRTRVVRRNEDLVFRLELYVSERDSYGVGFSDDVVVHRQLFVRAAPPAGMTLFDGLDRLQISMDPRVCVDPGQVTSWIPVSGSGGQWRFDIDEAAFHGEFAVELEPIATT